MLFVGLQGRKSCSVNRCCFPSLRQGRIGVLKRGQLALCSLAKTAAELLSDLEQINEVFGHRAPEPFNRLEQLQPAMSATRPQRCWNCFGMQSA
jgi:hypothetical protein